MRKLTRRTLLEGFRLGAAAGLLAPIVEVLVRDAYGAEPTAKRFVLLATGNGFQKERYLPPAVRGPSDFDLPASLAPLAPLASDLLLLERFYVAQTPRLHGSGFATTTNAPSPGGEEEDAVPGGISIDRAVGQAIGKDDAFTSLNLAHYHKDLYGSDNHSRIYVPHMSADGPGRINPPEWNPRRAFDKYFGGGVAQAGPSPDERARLGKSVLDRALQDVAAVSARLAGSERAKLDQYLESLRALERQVQKTATVTCTGPTAPAIAADEWPETIKKAWVDAYVDLIAQALACGVTHVASLSLMGMAGPDKRWEVLGSDNVHGLSHDQNHARLTVLEQYLSSVIVRLFDKLRSFGEGAGSVADGTVLLWINGGGGNHHNGSKDHPAVVVGHARRALKTGRYLSYPEGKFALARLFVSLQQAMGIARDVFGDPEHGTGALPGLV